MFLREALRGVDYNSLQTLTIEIKDIFTDFRNKAKILVIIGPFYLFCCKEICDHSQ